MKQNENTDSDYYGVMFESASMCLREIAYKHGKEIYDFMNKYDIGHSAYGKMMDAIGRAKRVIAHRLYGHHLIFDFPIDSPENIPAFLEHEFSDLFTKMGLPIIPGEMLEDTPLQKYCDKLTQNWNFVNGFDILSATIAIWQSIDKMKAAFNSKLTMDTFCDFANTFGIGVLECIIAFSSANPFLLIASALHLTSGIRGLFNDSAVIYFTKYTDKYSIEFSQDALCIEKYLEKYSINAKLDRLSIDNQLNSIQIQGVRL